MSASSLEVFPAPEISYLGAQSTGTVVPNPLPPQTILLRARGPSSSPECPPAFLLATICTYEALVVCVGFCGLFGLLVFLFKKKKWPQPFFSHASNGQVYNVARLFYLLRSFPSRQIVRYRGPGALKIEELEFRGRETNTLGREQKLFQNGEQSFAVHIGYPPHLRPGVKGICQQTMALGCVGWKDSASGLLPA